MLSNYLRRYEVINIISAVVMAILGVLMIIDPTGMADLIVKVFAYGLIVKGVVDVLHYIIMDNELKRYSNGLLEGLFFLLAGVFAILYPKYVASILPITLGLFVLFQAILKLQISFLFMGGMESASWVFVFLSAMAEIVLSFILLFYPANAVVTITIATGLILLGSALLAIIEAILMLNKLRYYSIY